MSDWPIRIRVGILFTNLLKVFGPEHIRAHKHCSKHRLEIERSKGCACFYCSQRFEPREIEEWTDEGSTAMCPRCEIDSVIGSASGYVLSDAFLQRMHNYWFERSYKIKV